MSRFDKILVMIACRHLLDWLFSSFRSRQDRILENLALRQQLWLSTPNGLAGD
jgi:hypothetical protein